MLWCQAHHYCTILIPITHTNKEEDSLVPRLEADTKVHVCVCVCVCVWMDVY